MDSQLDGQGGSKRFWKGEVTVIVVLLFFYTLQE